MRRNPMISGRRQKDVLDVLWIFLKECESKADGEKDALLRKQVECGYNLLNDIGFTSHRPVWEEREKQKNEEQALDS